MSNKYRSFSFAFYYRVYVVANLKPRKLRGLESKGMIIFADNGEKLALVSTDAEDGNSVS